MVNNGCHHRFGPDYDDDNGDNVRNTHYEATETSNFRINAGGHTKLRLIGINGDVTITGRPGLDSVIIIANKRVGSDSYRDAQLHLEDLNVIMQDNSSEVYVKTTQPHDNNGRNYVVDYLVYIPDYYEVYTDIVNGTVSIESINNFVTVNNVNGTVSLYNISGSTLVSLVNGQVKSRQGLPLNGIINLSTVNGNITLDIPRSTSAEFYGNMTNGNFSSSNLDFKNQSITPYTIRGTLGNGQGKIIMTTVNGRLSISGY
jgi:DUF4097 and DUF4098 domain-containing protein YvlB